MMSLIKRIHNFVMRHFSKPVDVCYSPLNTDNPPNEDIVSIPEEKGKQLNWNVDYFAQINVSELKPQDVIIFRISDDVELDPISLFKVRTALENKAASYGITNKVMVLYKVDMGIISPDKENQSLPQEYRDKLEGSA